MRFIADFHIHSHYSVATSKALTPENLDFWARRKGILVVGTGDVFHPGWYRDLEERLVPTGDGLFSLKQDYRIDDDVSSSSALQLVSFILSVSRSGSLGIMRSAGSTGMTLKRKKLRIMIMTIVRKALKSL